MRVTAHRIGLDHTRFSLQTRKLGDQRAMWLYVGRIGWMIWLHK